MSYFAIRDDDTSFFTSPEELDAVYAPYWGSIPISLATVPFSVSEHRGRRLSSDCFADTEMPLGQNRALVDWLRPKIMSSQVEILLHGFNHRYRKVDGCWIGEFGWKPESQLIQECTRGRAYLEALLDTAVRVFVPPSNTIGKAGIRAIREAGLNLSGVMARGGDRPFALDYARAYAKRWTWRLLRGDVYPFVLRYGGHSELRAHALTPAADAGRLMQSLEKCATLGAPYVLATHYWEFSDNAAMHVTLAELIGRAKRLGMTFVPVSRCFGVGA
jgi:hypothetical protein